MKQAGLKATLALVAGLAASPALAICNITVEGTGGLFTSDRTTAAAITHENMAEIAQRAQARGMNRTLGAQGWGRPLGGGVDIVSTTVNVYPFSSAERDCARAFERAIDENPGRVVGAGFLCNNPEPQTAISGGAPFQPRCGR
ncbi:MAG: hypothetical protein GW903_02185 [Alphaproteobacteria bacterium]|nr:hypothetical protein [Alphaproteobacteria bacterium]NCQ87780.1 hypothetical protein [Alphaproteobacteria bacterium]NCT05712.1 hypothetical protein [Alphaproteobacteria bacterium]